MSHSEVATRALERAGRWLQGAERALEDERWDDVVYCAQMCAEQAAKAVLLAHGVDYPKEHDVGDILVTLAERADVPKWFKGQVEEIAKIVSRLAGERGVAAYGYAEGVGADYFRDHAPETLAQSTRVFKACQRLISELAASQK